MTTTGTCDRSLSGVESKVLTLDERNWLWNLAAWYYFSMLEHGYLAHAKLNFLTSFTKNDEKQVSLKQPIISINAGEGVDLNSLMAKL